MDGRSVKSADGKVGQPTTTEAALLACQSISAATGPHKSQISLKKKTQIFKTSLYVCVSTGSF